jgi:hypothetical protein
MRMSVFVLLALFPAALQAQAASAYLERYRELERLAPDPAQVATVQNLSLRRDAGELLLQDGKLYLFAPVGGRVVAAVFQGAGRFKFAPPLPVEQEALQRYAGERALDVGITQAVLIFSDSTPEQLRALRFGSGEVPGGIDDQLRDVVNDLKGDHEGALSAAIMAPLLNAEPTGFFLAHIKRLTGEPLLFQLDPQNSEAVELFRPVGKIRWGTHWALVTRGPLGRPLPGSSDVWRLRHRLAVPHYRMDIRLTPTGSADLDFAAAATLRLAPQESVGPWLRFSLHPKLEIDSARWSDASGAPTFKAKDDDELWVRAPRRLAPGDSLSLSLYYHGNLIDRYGNWFYLDPSADWWPTNGQGTDDALFDITYHSPSWYPIASVGQRVDSTVQDRVKTTRWISQRNSPFATFNLGLFENYHQEKAGEPTLDVLISEDAHRLLRRQIAAEGGLMLQQRHMRETVAADVTNSLKFFTALFGEPPFQHFWVTEIPYFEGVSFPGVIHLSWSTFAQTSMDGFDEFFRAHEVAHQWWGNGVRPATYRDAWLSEGLAEFSGLWYLQTLKRRNDEYFKFLDQYATNIRGARNEVGPIAIGYRNASADTPFGYQYMIYEKGAWVFNMLRILMLDLQTRKEDRFTAMLRDFYTSYQGHTASTDDFQRVVERHAGIPMGWFFDQWVRGTAIPTYHVAWKNEEVDGGRYRVRLRVTQEGVPVDFQAFVLVSADLGSNRFANFRVGVTGTQAEYVSPLLPAPAKNVVFNELHSVLADVKTERW